MLKARLGDSGLATTVDEIGEKLAVALAELREFARGIHPAFLSERGVGAAVEALVARAPLNVDAASTWTSGCRPRSRRRRTS